MPKPVLVETKRRPKVTRNPADALATAPTAPTAPPRVVCDKSEDGQHVSSSASTFPFCIYCGEEL